MSDNYGNITSVYPQSPQQTFTVFIPGLREQLTVPDNVYLGEN